MPVLKNILSAANLMNIIVWDVNALESVSCFPSWLDFMSEWDLWLPASAIITRENYPEYY
jgi:hypothetical protein